MSDRSLNEDSKRKTAETRSSRRRGTAKPSKTARQGGGWSLSAPIAAAMLALSLYLASSLMTDWTGTLGEAIRVILTSLFGGAVIVPIIFSAYICASVLMRRRVPNPLSTCSGAALLYVSWALLLGLIQLAYASKPSSILLEPGMIGKATSAALFLHTGPLGTTIVGVGLALITLVCFGMRFPIEAAMSLVSAVAAMFGRGQTKGRHEIPDPADTLIEPEVPSDAEINEDETGAESEEHHERRTEPAPQQNLQAVNGRILYVNEPDEVIRERSRQLLERAREKTAEALAAAQGRKADHQAYETPMREETDTAMLDDFVLTRDRRDRSATASSVPPQYMTEADDEQLAREYAEALAERSASQRPIETQVDLEQETEQGDVREEPLTMRHELPADSDDGDGTGETEAAAEVPGIAQPESLDGLFPPPVELFGPDEEVHDALTVEMARPWGDRIIDSLKQFGIEADLAEILVGPTVIQFRIQPQPGVKVSKIVNLSDDLALNLAVSSLRVEAPIPGMPYVGIEIPNPKRQSITLRSILSSEGAGSGMMLPLPMGMTINGEPLVADLERLPHILVAGATGSGKSVFVNSCIVGLCSARTPDELRMILVDPKRVEMAIYDRLPHLLTPPIVDPKKAAHALGWAVREMERRYDLCAAVKVRNITSYNKMALPKDRLPRIVIIIDELADLMMTTSTSKEVEEFIVRIAQMARAVGMHLMLATQRPSVNVITGLIKANVPARVAFTVSSSIDSRTILDGGGAEKLLGRGDMLLSTTDTPKPLRVQSPWIDERSIMDWLHYLNEIFGEPEFEDIESQGASSSDGDDSEMYDDDLLATAVRTVLSSGIASASGLQRRLRVGFSRAGRLIDMMESAGIIGPQEGSRPREILVNEDEAEEILERIIG